MGTLASLWRCLGAIALLAGFAAGAEPARATNDKGMAPARLTESGLVRVLSIGCSYSGWNNWPLLLEDMLVHRGAADSMGLVYVAGPAWSLVRHDKRGTATNAIERGGPENAPSLSNAVEKLKAELKGKPDRVYLQRNLRAMEAQSRMTANLGWDFVFMLFFSEDYLATDEELGRILTLFSSAARAKGARPVIWLPWGGRSDVKRFVPIAHKLDLLVVPACFAQQLASRSGRVEQKTRTAWPGGHPDAKEEFLYACTFYAALTGESPEGVPCRTVHGANGPPVRIVDDPADPLLDIQGQHSPYPHDVEFSEAEAKRLQRAAWDAILEYRLIEAECAGRRGNGAGILDANPPLPFNLARKRAWTAELPAAGNGAPVVFGDRILVGDARGLSCFDLAGQSLWRFAAPESSAAAPEQPDPVPVLSAGGAWAVFKDGRIVRCNTNGTKFWEARVPVASRFPAASPLVVGDNTVVQGKELVCFDGAGKALWRKPVPAPTSDGTWGRRRRRAPAATASWQRHGVRWCSSRTARSARKPFRPFAAALHLSRSRPSTWRARTKAARMS
jgi:hypothetical protein